MRLFVGDTETAGQQDGAGVCEIALIEIDENLNYITHFESRLDPEMPICPGASGVHGITDEDVENQPTLREWVNIVGIYEIGLAAHNARFDAEKLQPTITVPITLDTLKLAQRYIPDAPNHKLSTLVYYCNLPRSAGSFHSAMTDTWACFYLVRLLANETGKKTFTELAIESNTPRELTHFPNFGKFSGRPIEEVDSGYFRWCLKNFDRMDIDLEYTIKKRLGMI